MKKREVNEIFIDESKRKKHIILFSAIIIFITLLSILSIYMHIVRNKVTQISYKENSNINYKVFLKENQFFKNDYAEEKKQYIASLIDYIKADFNYNINIEKDDVDFDYVYSIKAEVNVMEKNKENSLYDFSETLLENVEMHSNKKKNISINESINIDYNHFNEVVKSFINIYKLDNIESNLVIKLYVKGISTCNDFVSDENIDSVVSLIIPLTEKTMSIDISNDLVDNNYKIQICESNNKTIKYLIFTIIFIISDIGLIIYLLKYINKTRTKKDIYNMELKRILSDYHTYIQKVSNSLELKGYQLVAIDNFDDMLEIKDALSQPILMVESKDKTGTHFIIPSNTKLMYTYTLKIDNNQEDLKTKKRGK